MKITKLKKGYRIDLTDNEMGLLQAINDEGLMGYTEMHHEDMTGLSTPEKRILTEINNDKREWL